MRLPYKQAVKQLALLPKIHEFTPQIIGTPPLNIELETSDIDIACSANDLGHFTQVATTEFGTAAGFQCRHSHWQNQATVIVQFHACGWDIELFCQEIPTSQQWGVRHFHIEQRLLNLAPGLKSVVVQLKQAGLKTEPAFARALGISGDPYAALLELQNMSDADLTDLMTSKMEKSNPSRPPQQRQTGSCCQQADDASTRN